MKYVRAAQSHVHVSITLRIKNKYTCIQGSKGLMYFQVISDPRFSFFTQL